MHIPKELRGILGVGSSSAMCGIQDLVSKVREHLGSWILDPGRCALKHFKALCCFGLWTLNRNMVCLLLTKLLSGKRP
jgi:hypothetical protein